jgi:hypothetical protein
MHLAVLSPILVAFCVAGVTGQTANISQVDTILDNALRAEIAAIVKKSGLPGYSLAILRVGAPTEEEFGSWGMRTESGDKLDENVRIYHLLSLRGR